MIAVRTVEGGYRVGRQRRRRGSVDADGHHCHVVGVGAAGGTSERRKFPAKIQISAAKVLAGRD